MTTNGVVHERVIRNSTKSPLEKKVKPKTVTHAPVWEMHALRSAIMINAAVAVVEFTLNYGPLHNLAQKAGYGILSYLWPLPIDGTIILANLAIVLLRYSKDLRTRLEPGEYRRNRYFCWSTLLLGGCISVGGNMLQKAVGDVIPTILAVGIGCVAPVSLLITTHMISMLVSFFLPKGDQ